MSAKQLLRLGLVFAALVLLWGAAALAHHRAGSPIERDVFHLPAITRSSVDTVLLARPGDTTVLARKDSSTWTVNGYPAASKAVAELLASLEDSTPGSELVAERRTSHASLGVDSATGTRARVKARGRTVLDVLVGRRSPDFSGGYLRQADEEPTYLVRGRLVEVLSRSTDDWRDHRIAAVPADSVAALEVWRGADHYEMKRAGKGWSLSSGGAADSARAVDLLGAYRDIEASGFASPAQADSAKFTPPDRRTRVLRKDGEPLLTLLFDSTTAGAWVRADTGTTIYRMDLYSADRLAPADSSLRPRTTVRKQAKAG